MHGFFSQASQDQDGDFIADDFESFYGLSPGDPSDAGLDLDLDGLTNLEEYRLGTCPDRLDSAFRTRYELSQDGESLTLRWMSRPQNRYVLEESSSLDPTTGWQAIGQELVAPSDVAVTEATISIPLDRSLGFFRVRLVESSVPVQ